MTYLTLIVIAIISFALGFYIKGKTKQGAFASKSAEEMSEIHDASRKALSERTEGRKERILYLMNSELVHQKELIACGVADIKKGITRDNVEKFLDVSSDTARRYLDELEEENKIEQVGDFGRGVYYTLI